MARSITEFADEYPSIADLPAEERHGLLASERRRSTLAVLTGRTAPVDLADLAAAVAARERTTGETVEMGGGSVLDRIELALHHAHLPRLDQMGVVDYDPDSHRVTP